MTSPFSRNDILDDIVTLAVVTMHPDRYIEDDGGHNGHGTAGTWRKAWMAPMSNMDTLAFDWWSPHWAKDDGDPLHCWCTWSWWP